MKTPSDEYFPDLPVRSQTRQFVALLVIGAATAQALGLTLNLKSQLGANDMDVCVDHERAPCGSNPQTGRYWR